MTPSTSSPPATAARRRRAADGRRPRVRSRRATLGCSLEGVGALCARVEERDFDSIWVIDHLVGFPPERGVFEAWTSISALVALTTRVGVGAQVLCQSFRSPALLAKMATSLDLASEGRLRFLLGAGWFEPEYRAFGFEFPSPRRARCLRATKRCARRATCGQRSECPPFGTDRFRSGESGGA